MALDGLAQIEAAEREAARRAEKVARLKDPAAVGQMRDLLLSALPVARDAGLSNTELSDAWSIPRDMIRDYMDRVHRNRRA